jgi:predicted RNase H-like HicB family nuclease
MAEENKDVIEEVTENVEQPTEEVVKETTTQPRDEDGKFVSRFDSADDPSVIKVNLDAPPPLPKEEKEEKQEQEVVEENKEEKVEEVKEEVKEEVVEQPMLEEVSEQVDNKEETVEEVKEVVEEAVEEAIAAGEPLPENIQKLVDFMDETGGDIQDYVNLNRDVSKMDDSDVLDEYYRITKSHLSAEERNFLLEDTFGVDEDIDDEKTIRKKKIALKEQVAEAKAYLDGQKSKYYEDIKAGSKLTSEQQKAIDFFNRYNKDQEQQNKLNEESKKVFLDKTNNLFNNEFKGFEYNVGDKKYRFNVKDVDKVKNTQSDINNFINKFVNEGSATIDDAAGYHKSLFTAMNADAIAKHFYEQGKADATKQRVAKDKNINLEPRKTHGETNVGGVKYKVLGQSSVDLKNRSFKIRKKN